MDVTQINDTLDAILVGCLAFGLILSAVSILLGGIDLDAGSGEVGGSWLGGVNGALAAVGWFGGVGLIARNAIGLVAPLAVLVALTGGIAGARVVAIVLRRLVREGTALDPAQFELPGILARVSSSIRPGGVGEIIYEQGGVRRVSAARAEHGDSIGRGAEVVVLTYRGGIATVAAWEDLMRPRDDVIARGAAPQLGPDVPAGPAVATGPAQPAQRALAATHRTV